MKPTILIWLFFGLASCAQPKRTAPAEEPAKPDAAKHDAQPEAKQPKERPTPSDAKVIILQAKGAPARYQLGDRATGDLAELGRWLRRLKESFDEGGVTPQGSVHAARHVRWSEVEKVLQELADAGFDKVDLGR